MNEFFIRLLVFFFLIQICSAQEKSDIYFEYHVFSKDSIAEKAKQKLESDEVSLLAADSVEYVFYFNVNDKNQSIAFYLPQNANAYLNDSLLNLEQGSFHYLFVDNLPKLNNKVRILAKSKNLFVLSSSFFRVGSLKEIIRAQDLDVYINITAAIILIVLALTRLFTNRKLAVFKANLYYSFFLFSVALSMDLDVVFYLFPQSSALFFLALFLFSIVAVLSIFIFICLFLIRFFHYPHEKRLLGVLFSIILFALFILENDILIYFVLTLPSLYVLLWVFLEKKEKPYKILIGILFILMGILFINNGFYSEIIAIIAFTYMLDLSILDRIRLQLKELSDLKLRSSILERELLKKSIQPHFILNSLNAVISWLENQPEKGIELIAALSEEFRLINQISEKKLLSIRDEIRLCKSHLEIMGLRKNKRYELKTKLLDETKNIPPAVFHTLIENVISHDKSKEKTSDICLVEKEFPKKRVYYLASKNSQGKSTKKKSGLGFQYIEARLEESYKGKWRFRHKMIFSLWISIVEIYDKDMR